MSTLQHPLFGTLDLSAAGDWEATQQFGGRELEIDLTLDAAEAPVDKLTARIALLDKLGLFDKMARIALADEMADGEEAATGLYVVHHAEELPEAEWKKIYGTPPEETTEDAFLEKLELKRVGLYPGDADRCVLLDYSLPGEVTNYVLSVAIDENGQISAIDMES